MKRRLFSLLLVAALCFSLLPGTAARAVNSDSGMVISKTATANGNGSYTISLEAYATGAKVISSTEKDKPTDIILVLDQSGSMVQQKMATVTFTPYTNKQNGNYYEYRHNGGSKNLWHLLPDGSYVSVSVTVTDVGTSYKPFSGSNSDYFDNQNNLYILDDNDVYQPVTVSYDYSYSGKTYTYSVDGAPIATGTTSWRGNDNPPSGITFYTGSFDYTHAVYTYTYTDSDGTHTITTSTGSDTECEETFYNRTVNNDSTRLDALKIAATSFVDSVAAKAKGADGQLGTADDISHRIAVVGFAHGTERSNSFDGGYNYVNTELFIGATQYTYGSAATAMYGSAYQAMNTAAGVSNVNASIGALSALGATQVDLGMEMAQGILNNNTVDPSERNQVVIVFTDGFPSSYSTFSSTIANSAIDTAKTMKDNKVTVYSIGVFDGADATSAGSQNGNDTQRSNWFLQNLSSNNGTPPSTADDVSYYLSAADSSSLNSVFKKISEQIESGGTTATLGEETVIKDIISPSFALPADATAADITLETYQCTGMNGDAYTWSKNADAKGAQATVNGDQVSVTGFDFADNYVGTVTDADGSVTYRGHKLVISFTVKPKDGFLGGNNVYTNTMAGIYENGSATEPVLEFERPQVNVPIGDVSVTADDQNVYLLSDVTGASLKAGTKVTVGGVSLDLDPAATNYGLEPWQNKFVSIDVKLLDGNGKEITDFNDLVNDATYSVSVTVSPKTNGQDASGTPAEPKSGSGNASIYVYKPYIVFQDSSINAGDTPNYATDNFVSVAWKHGEVTAPTTMGTAPVLTYTYDPVAAPLSAESQVKVSVAMNVTDDNSQGDDVTQYVSFYRNACTAENGCDFQGGAVSATDANRVNFIVHIKTFDLTITKRGTNSIDHDDSTERQSYIFHVTGPNGFKMDVVICGDGSKTIKNLPVGNYTITEDENWSWRYTAQPYTVTPDSIKGGSATVTVENTRDNDKWLNGGAYVSNLFSKLKSGN
ncbi:VWA domain-containing protein [bacterium]|nr:VWA domain-containing protein [bacterium]